MSRSGFGDFIPANQPAETWCASCVVPCFCLSFRDMPPPPLFSARHGSARPGFVAVVPQLRVQRLEGRCLHAQLRTIRRAFSCAVRKSSSVLCLLAVGAAVYVEGSAITRFDSCQFVSNTAIAGGKHLLTFCASELFGSAFPGAVSLNGDSINAFSDCVFQFNVAKNGIGQLAVTQCMRRADSLRNLQAGLCCQKCARTTRSPAASSSRTKCANHHSAHVHHSLCVSAKAAYGGAVDDGSLASSIFTHCDFMDNQALYGASVLNPSSHVPCSKSNRWQLLFIRHVARRIPPLQLPQWHRCCRFKITN